MPQSTSRLDFARSVSFNIVASYWDVIQGGQSRLWTLPSLNFRVDTSIDDETAASARELGGLAAQFDPVEAAFRITSVYAGLLPSDYRSSNGVFYTPPALTHRLLATSENADLDWKAAHVLDPACGGGAFLMPIAARMANSLSDRPPEIVLTSIEQRLLGFEKDPFGAWSTQVFVESALMNVCRAANRRLKPVVKECDSLLQFANPRKFDLVIGNPPYGRISLPDGIREKYRRVLFGHANLYTLFTDLSLRLSRPGGLLALVTPTSFLAGEYFKGLRHVLTLRTTPLNFDLVASRKGVFDDVLQETVLTTYRNSPGGNEPCTVNRIDAEGDAVKVNRIGRLVRSSQGGEPWIIARRLDQAPVIRAMSRHRFRLSDYGYEVVTGQLVWNRHKGQLRGEYTLGVYPLIWAEAVGLHGHFEFKADKRNHQPYFKPTEGQSWLITRETCMLLQRTTAKEQNRRLIAAILPDDFLRRWGGVVVENHLNIIRPAGPDPRVPLATMCALLNSRVLDEAFRCISGSVAVSAYELNSLPLPDPACVLDLSRDELLSETPDRWTHHAYLLQGHTSNGATKTERRQNDTATAS